MGIHNELITVMVCNKPKGTRALPLPRRAGVSYMLLSLILTFMTMASLPDLTQAATQRLKPGQSDPMKPLSPNISDIFDSGKDRSAGLKGNGEIKQDEINNILKDDDLTMLTQDLM